MIILGKFIKIASLSALVSVSLFSGYLYFQPAYFYGNNPPAGSSATLPLNENKAANPAAADEQTVAMLFLGDLMLDRQVKKRIDGAGADYLFEGFNKDNFDFNKYQLISANLEGAVTEQGNHYPPIFSYDFAFAPDIISEFKKYNFNFFNLANNHITDQGERGRSETEDNLKQLGFEYSGCADGLVGECSSTIKKIGDLNIGFVGFSQVYKRIDLAEAGKVVGDLSGQTDLVVVNFHWGEEYNHFFNKIQAETAHRLIDAGADLIIGHHPHVVQGVESYKQKLIFYSLGNFIFDQYFSPDTQESLALDFSLSSPGEAEIRLYPLTARQSQPSLMTGKEKEDYLLKIASWSRGEAVLIDQVGQGEINLAID